MDPNQVSAQLRQIAARIEKSRKPAQRLVTRDLRALVASMEHVSGQSSVSKCFTVGIYGSPGTSIKHEDVDVTSMMESPFREAGASHFSWNKGGCQMMVPPEAVPAVIQALRAAQEGGYGDELKKFYDGFQHEYTLDHMGNRVMASSRTAASALEFIEDTTDGPLTEFVLVSRACEFSAKNPGQWEDAANALFDALGLTDSGGPSDYNTAD